MNYQKIEIESGEVLHIDLSTRRTACRDCGELIRFGIRENGKYYPVSPNEDRTGFISHFKVCEKKEPERNFDEQDRNQEYLNSL